MLPPDARITPGYERRAPPPTSLAQFPPRGTPVGPLSTNLTPRDGGSLLMGGLVSNSQRVGEGGVPGLGRVPVLGRLFRKDAFRRDRAELAIL